MNLFEGINWPGGVSWSSPEYTRVYNLDGGHCWALSIYRARPDYIPGILLMWVNLVCSTGIVFPLKPLLFDDILKCLQVRNTKKVIVQVNAGEY